MFVIRSPTPLATSEDEHLFFCFWEMQIWVHQALLFDVVDSFVALQSFQRGKGLFTIVASLLVLLDNVLCQLGR